MANAFVAMCYATAKKAGVDTSKMSPDDVIEWYNKQQGKKEAKEKTKEIIKNYVANNQQKAEKKGNSDNTKNEFFVEKIDRNNKEELKSKVIEFMNKIVHDDVEHHVVIDKDGNIYERLGEEDSVDDVGVDLNGGISIHNHLTDNSFSQTDFSFFRDKIGTEFINVTPKYTHKLKVVKEIDKPYNYFYRKGLKRDADWTEQDHNIMEAIKSEGYIEYERNLRNT